MTLGRAYIEIVADGSNFSRSLREQVARDLDREMGGLGREGGQTFVGGYEQGVRRGTPQAERAGDDLGHSTTRRLGAAGETGGRDFTSGVASGMRRGGGAVDSETDRIGARITSRTSRIGDDAGRSLSSQFSKKFKEIDSEISPALDKVGSKLMGFAGTTAKWSSIIVGASYGVVILGEALLSLLPTLLQVGGAMVQLSGIALGIPAALGPLVLAFTTVKFALDGFGKAMTAVDDAAFQKATANMGAQSKQLASTLRDMMPQFRSVQQAAQDAFSAQVLDNIRGVAGAVIGPLRAGFATLGTDLGRAANQLGAFLASAQGVQLLQGWFDSADIGMQALTRGLTPLLTGFANLARVTKPIFDAIAVSVGDLETRFGNWLTRISASGQAFTWLQAAVDGFRNLGAILANVGRIFLQLFQASGAGAKDLLGTLALLTGGFARFLATAEGQNVLAQFFEIIRTSGTVVMNVLLAVGRALAGIAAPAAQVAAALGPGLTAIVDALGQALVALAPALVPLFAALSLALQAIAPMLPQLAAAFANLIIAISPLIPLLGPIIAQLGVDLANGLNAAIPLINILAGALGFMLAHFNTATIWEAVAAFVALRTTLLLLKGVMAVLKFVELIQNIGQLAEKCGAAKVCENIGKVGTAPTGVAQRIGGAAQKAGGACPEVDQCATSAARAAGPLSNLSGLFAGMGGVFGKLITGIGLTNLQLLALIAVIALVVVGVVLLIKHWDQVIAFFQRLPGYLMTAVSAVGAFAQAIPGYLLGAFDAIVGFFAGLPAQIAGFLAGLGSAFVSFVTALPGMILGLLSAGWAAIWGFLQQLPALILQGLLSALQGVAYALGAGIALIIGVFVLLPIRLVQLLLQWIPTIVGFFIALPGQIMGAIAGLIGLLVGFFASMFGVTIGIIVGWVGSVISFFASLPGLIWNAIAALPAMLIGFFTGLWTSTVAIVTAMINGIVAFFIALPGYIMIAIAALPVLLFTFFTYIWTTWIGIVNAMISAVVAFFIALPGWIMGAIAALPGLLFAFFTWIWTTLVGIVTAMVNQIVAFFVALPGWIMGAIAALPGMLASFFTGIWQDAVRLVTALVNDVVGVLASLPGRVAGALAGLADALAGPFRAAANAVFGVIDAIAKGFDDVIGKFPGGSALHIPPIPRLARGGVVPGTGNRDSQLALLTPGEGVLTVAGLRRLGGKQALDALNRRTSRIHYGPDGVQRFGLGGVVGAVANAASSGWAKGLGIAKELLKMVEDPTGFLNDLLNGQAALRTSGDDFADRLRQVPVGILNAAVNELKKSIDTVKDLYDAAGNMIRGVAGAVGGFISNFVGGLFSSSGAGLSGWIAQAMAITGVPANWAGPLMTLIMRESGGNPNAINNWDINAQNGDPSRGLMQTIGSTFNAYRDPNLSNNIYDPVANIVAGIRYILATYGTIFNVQQAVGATPMGYDLGGIITSPQLAALHANEVVIPLSRPSRAVQLANESGLTGILASRSGSGNGTVINAPITVNAPQSNPELIAWNVSARIARLAASGVG